MYEAVCTSAARQQIITDGFDEYPQRRGVTNTPNRGNPAVKSTRPRGRGNSKPHQVAQAAIITPPPSETSQKADKKSVHWTNDQTDLLVTWLTSHPADCHVLFYENKGDQDHLTGKPSAKDKTGIHEIITKHIFEMDEDWAQQYTNSPKKFSTCVSNRISYLRKTFIKHYSKLNQTGQGVQPGDGAVNSHELVLKDFPWYNELYGIWNGIPNFTAKITTSQPGKSRGASHLKLIATHGKGTPPPDESDGDDVPYEGPTAPENDVNMEWEGGEGEMYQEGGEDEPLEDGDMDIDDTGAFGGLGKRKATDDLDDRSPSPEHFQFPDKGNTSSYDSRQTGFQLAATKAHAVNSRAASHPSSSRAASRPPSSHAASRPPSSRAASRPPSSRTASRPPSSRAASRPPSSRAVVTSSINPCIISSPIVGCPALFTRLIGDVYNVQR
ncbi:hypothetical protein BU15DRAFT_65173 [Melanogaster broomeanus]|nr:hypothetical protein BU15DRAFT_65173 [Melanogaster broomeanus]